MNISILKRGYDPDSPSLRLLVEGSFCDLNGYIRFSVSTPERFNSLSLSLDELLKKNCVEDKEAALSQMLRDFSHNRYFTSRGIDCPRTEAFYWLRNGFDYLNVSNSLISKTDEEETSYPAITLKSFSIECFLKGFVYLTFTFDPRCDYWVHKQLSLIKDNTKKLIYKKFRSHKPSDLFNLIPCKVRTELCTQFQAEYGEDLSLILSSIDHDFVDSRYYFEDLRAENITDRTVRNFNISGLNKVADFLSNFPEKNEKLLEAQYSL